MGEIKVIYWSMTGNTKTMAEAIGQGIEAAGKVAVLQEVSEASVDELKEVEVFALGCPAMGAEVLEEDEMEPFVAELETAVNGKTIALFGSYDWGDGEWMRNWVERMQNAGAKVLNDEGTICQNEPDDAGIEKCESLGRQLAEI